MGDLRREERWAAACMAEALGVEVVQHDDGTRDAMHDLDVLHPSGTAAAEVSACADREAIEAWNAMNRDGFWQLEGLQQQWTVSVRPSVRVKVLRRELAGLLVQIESGGNARRLLEPLGIRAHVTLNGRPGRVYLVLDLPHERTGGARPSVGDSVAEWAGVWLREPQQQDILRKLAAAGAAERHVFAWVATLSEAPFAVQSVLMESTPPLPTVPPNLPPEVTHLWIASMWSSPAGLYWSPGQGWRWFEKVTTVL